MHSINQDTSIKQLQSFIKDVYSLPNDRHFDLSEMLCNVQRFAMRGLKGIRKGEVERVKKNLLISFSWFVSMLNRLHIDIEDEVWKRFPDLCSYCGTRPCSCKAQKIDKRQKVPVDQSHRPGTLAGFQKMFNSIYPSSTRTLEHAGVHLAEEIGEFSEALLAYRGERTNEDFQEVMLEAADYFSCMMGVFNSLGIDVAQELSKMYPNNCHECFSVPCVCGFVKIKSFKS